ncbi:MAG: hypothetical protein GXX06_12480 [Gammaproteobacteria bacterium]|nr:hypothetical protein [Gammaproteobacteria bacterium]
MDALAQQATVLSYEERNLGQGNDAQAVALTELSIDGLSGSYFGVGIHTNSTTASIFAVLSALARISSFQCR